MDVEEITAKLTQIIQPFLKDGAGELSGMSFAEAQIDSLSLIEIAYQIEEEFDLTIENEELEAVVRLEDLAGLIQSKLAASGKGRL